MMHSQKKKRKRKILSISRIDQLQALRNKITYLNLTFWFFLLRIRASDSVSFVWWATFTSSIFAICVFVAFSAFVNCKKEGMTGRHN